ncbi:MAG: ATP-binding cassette domain-containing protein [Paracoccaceae bacterium]
MSAPCLEMTAARYIVRNKTLLGPLDLSLASAGITCILGPNGAGKSLFLALAHGMIVPHQGHVMWNGQPAADTRQSRGFVFQSTPVLRRSVRANLAFPLAARRCPAKDRAARVEQALHDARLMQHADSPAAALSGGERQRLALAQAMVARPTAVLLDEPGASLDPASAKLLEDMVRAVAASGTKVILATHDLPAARRLADDVLVFIGGQLAMQAGAEGFFAGTHGPAVMDYLEGRI